MFSCEGGGAPSQSGRPAAPGGLSGLHHRFENAFQKLQHATQHPAALPRSPSSLCRVLLVFCAASCSAAADLGNDFFPRRRRSVFGCMFGQDRHSHRKRTARLVDQIERSIRTKIPASELSGILDNIGLPTSGINLSYSNSERSAMPMRRFSAHPDEHHPMQLCPRRPSRRASKGVFPGTSFFSFEPAHIVSQHSLRLPARLDVRSSV